MQSVERPVVLGGRLADPTRADEAVVTQRFVSTYGKGVGDTVTALLPTPEENRSNPSITGPQPSGPRLTLHIVGVVRSPWFSDGPHSHGRLLPTAALLRSYEPNLLNDATWANALVRLRGGEAALPAFKADLARVTGRSDLTCGTWPRSCAAASRRPRSRRGGCSRSAPWHCSPRSSCSGRRCPATSARAWTTSGSCGRSG